MRIYDGDTYIAPEMYWATPDGLEHTRAVASTGLFDLSMWSWCGQQSENSEAQVNQYLLAMDQLGSQFPQTRFILMTGHSDGTSGGTLAHNNQMVRDYAIAHGKVLFDFEDIDTHDPDGNCYPNDADGACTWCDDWCVDHPGDCANVPDSCAHSENTEAQQFTVRAQGQRLLVDAGPPGPAGTACDKRPILLSAQSHVAPHTGRRPTGCGDRVCASCFCGASRPCADSASAGQQSGPLCILPKPTAAPLAPER